VELGEQRGQLMDNIGYFEGYSSHNSINFCPLCGEDKLTYKSDGSAKCDNCQVRVAVIEIDESEENDDE
jgi:hypothetical protein